MRAAVGVMGMMAWLVMGMPERAGPVSDWGAAVVVGLVIVVYAVEWGRRKRR